MLIPSRLARLLLCCVGSTLLAQAPSHVRRLPYQQEELCCLEMRYVKPDYPKEARLAHTEGKVELQAVFGLDGSVIELQPMSGDPLLVESAMKAVRQWHVDFGKGFEPFEHEIKLTFTFQIEEAPKPAYLTLVNGKVIRADSVREFTDGIEYTVGTRTHHLPAGSINDIARCDVLSVHPGEGACIPGGGPIFNIRSLPLLVAKKKADSKH